MKAKVIILFIFIVFSSCKKEEKTLQVDSKKNELVTPPKKNKKPIVTILDFIDYELNKDVIVVNENLGDLIDIKEASLFREAASKKVFIVLKINDNIPKEIISDYTIISRMYPYSIDDLREESVRRNLEFDSWYFPIKIRDVKGDKFIFAQVADDNDGFKKVILQLLNKNTKKISSKKIILENLEA